MVAGTLAGWLAAAVLGAAAAEAARVVDVRVGRHPDFVRVVFETDAPAGFVVERGEPGESRVRIEAAAAPGAVAVPDGTGAEVILEPLPGGATLARIRAAAPVRIESQVLDRPPRIVFDLHPSAAEPAAAEPASSQPAREPEEPAPPGPAREPEEPAPAGPAREPEAEAAAPAAPRLASEVESPPIFPDLARPLAEAPGSPELELPAAAPAWEPMREPPDRDLAEPSGSPELRPPGGEGDRAPLPPAPAEPAVPPVSAPPPGAIAPRLDERSLLLGAAGGLALGLGVALLARGRRRAPPAAAPALPEMPVETVEDAAVAEERASAAPEGASGPEPVAEPEQRPLRMAPWPASEPLAADLLTMIQRLDERCAGAEQALEALVERTGRLERRSSSEAEELASQRVALTRIDRALGRPLAQPEPRAPEPEPASTPPPRPS